MPVLDGYDATRLIRKDPNPAVRSVLIIAMTASAIRGDREKCIDAGMNNYLAKPVRANVLKTMLEGYLSQDAKPMTELQETANKVAKEAVDAIAKEDLEKRASVGGAKAVEAVAAATANGIGKAREQQLAQRPKVDVEGEEETEVQEWPSLLRRPPLFRGVSSSADSTETVTGPTRKGDRA